MSRRFALVLSIYEAVLLGSNHPLTARERTPRWLCVARGRL